MDLNLKNTIRNLETRLNYGKRLFKWGGGVPRQKEGGGKTVK